MTDFNISVFQDVFRGIYIATLIECEFSNCHGEGKTESEAIANLKIRATATAKLAWAEALARVLRIDELTIPTCKWVMNELQKDEIAELEQDND